MAQLQLYKGTQKEYDDKKDKIAEGGLIVVKDEDSSQTGNLYINDNGTHVRLSDDKAFNASAYANGTLTMHKINGESKTVLEVDSALSSSSLNPIQNKIVTSQIGSLQNRTGALESKVTQAQSNISSLQNRMSSAESRISNNDSNISALQSKVATLNGSDTGKTVRKIANEELAAQLLAGNDNFTKLEELAAWLDEHPEDATAMNNAINQLDADKAEAREISQADYNALSDEEKYNGTFYLIYDANGFVGMEAQFAALQERVTALEQNQHDTASEISFIDTASGLSTNNVQGAIDALNTKVNANYNTLNSKIDTVLGDIETLLSQI